MKPLLSAFLLCLLLSCSNTTSDDINNENGEPVDIFQAIREADTKAVKSLLARPHDLTDVSIEGVTSLMLATRLGHFDMIEALLNKGGNIYYRVNGQSAADLGVDSSKPKVSDLYKTLLKNDEDKYQQIKMAIRKGDLNTLSALFSEGFYIDYQDNEGNSFLSEAIFYQQLAVSEQLLKWGANPQLTNQDGWSALLYACEIRSLEHVELLLSYITQVNLVTNQGESCLHVLAEISPNQHEETELDIADLLILADIDLDLVSNSGFSAVNLAIVNNKHQLVEELIGAEANIELVNNKAISPLISAIYHGYYSMVQRLIGAGVSVNLPDGNGKTSLHHALSGIYKGDEDSRINIVSALLAAGAKVNTVDSQHLSPLHLAIINDLPQVFDLLLNHQADVNIATNKAWTALHFAISKGDVAKLKSLLKHSIILDAQISDSQQTALSMLTDPAINMSEDKRLELMTLLINAGADLNIQDAQGRTALYLTVLNEQNALLEHLIKSGAKVNLVDNNAQSALFQAVMGGRDALVKRLLSVDADPLLANKHGWTALHYAASEKISEDEQVLINIIDSLLNAGMNIDAAMPNGYSPLFKALASDNQVAMKHLLARKANPDQSLNNGFTPLMYAVQYGNLDAIYQLLAAGADPDLQLNQGWTALHFVANKSNKAPPERLDEIIEILIRAGSDPHIRNKEGLNVLHLATMNQRLVTIQSLFKHAKHKLNVNSKSKGKSTAIMFAASQGDLELVKYLHKQGANLHQPTKRKGGVTVFDVAKKAQQVEVLEYLNSQR